MHFEAIARVLGVNDASQKVIDGFVRYFEYQNPRFDRYRFKEAIEEARGNL